MPHCQTLVIGDQRVQIASITQTLHDEIFFLQDRIALLKRQSVENSGVLITYQDLLESRISVLHWLNNYSSGAEQVTH
ncbi:hypothetical protein G8770_13175 [Aestuariicella hydrocarbonica]|uniref:Uncharacterized protein n=1 Tax=Pseudomaricurvus hydrocarbonicus TaxID=1470433 RepID=A0A9E5JTX9_9GAMM|nr:hypothetical protein [Aestuariicella hydrocarbonica]NHO66494.1 hypothetical protein [Aestuariicella hydrocarbonica]